MHPSASDLSAFQAFIRRFWLRHGRHELPWRLDHSPYAVLVSELMLQQTQVERVVPKYQAWMKRFPDLQTLAQAELGEVIRAWQGLGYNRRAKFLWQTAQEVSSAHPGRLPRSREALLALPGIGPYTAQAIMSFAYNQAGVLIETNVRSIFLHHFFPDQIKVSDTQLLPLIDATLDHQHPREWYWALMDYGAVLKRLLPNPNRRSKHHAKQSRFEGSRRQIRGQVLRMLSKEEQSEAQLQRDITDPRLPEILDALVAEGFITVQSNSYQLC